MKSKKNIVLIGMMGSGKSSIGKRLSKILLLDFIDIDYKKTGFALVHAAEQKCKVKYRYLKSFTGEYFKNNKKKKVTVKMFVKRLNLGIDTLITKAMDKHLNKLNAIKIIQRSGIKFTIIDLKKSFYLMVKDLNGKKEFIKTKKIN